MGYLVHNKHQSSTVKSYISAIKTTLKTNLIDISEDQYLLSSLTRACRLQNDCMKTRLPTQKGMLSIILHQAESHFKTQPFLLNLYPAILSTMYFGLFRISEMTSDEHAVRACDVHIGSNKCNFLFVLHTLKMHDMDVPPQLIKITTESRARYRGKQPIPKRILPCPYQLLKDYAQMRGGYKNVDEHFFIFSDHSPVRPRHLSICLKMLIHQCGFDESLYGSHSLRIGRTCDLFHLGLSVETIKKLGHWKSNAVFRYLCT